MRSLTVSELFIFFQKIISKLGEEGYDKIEFNNDLYRIIPTEKWSSFGDVSIDNCSLFDDIDRLKELTQNPDRRCTYVDFDRLASVLREISQKNNPV